VNLVSGRIDARVTFPANGIIDMATVSGEIELDIPRNTSAELSANVVSGTISVINLSLRNVTRSPTTLQGTLGGGQGLISLGTTSGNIRVEGY
jgi:DUF4097 and DUF4098 domain-containing protein YvlB